MAKILSGLLAFAALHCLGCTESIAGTEVMLEIHADAAIRARLSALRVSVHVSDDEGEHWEESFEEDFQPPDGGWPESFWPARLGLVPGAGHEQRMFDVQVQALGAGDEVIVRQSGVSRFVAGRTKVLRIVLEAACALDRLRCGSITCVGPQCVTCRAGVCEEVGILELSDYDPGFGHRPGDGGEPLDATHDAGEDGGPEGGVGGFDGGQDSGQDSSIDPDAAPAEGGLEDATLPEPLRVVSTSPDDDGTLDDATADVEVTFTAELDEDTLDADTFVVSREGVLVPGTIDVNDDRVRFSPDVPFALAGRYEVELTNAIRDVDDRALAPDAFSFTVREGDWSVELLGDADSSCHPYVAVAPSGFATVVYNHYVDGYPTIWARQYSPTSANWSDGVELEDHSMAPAPTFRCRVAVNSQGYAIAAWDLYDAVYFRGFTTGPFWNQRGTLDGSAYGPELVMTETDQAFAVLQLVHASTTITGFDLEASDMGWTSYPLSSTSSGDQQQVALLDDGAMGVWQQSSGPPAVSEIWAGGIARLSCTSSDWSCPQAISGTTTTASVPQIASDPNALAAVVVWQQSDATWSNIWSSRIVAGGSWSEPVRVSDDLGAATQPAIGVDVHGRAHAVWQQTTTGTSRIMSAVFEPGEGWSEPAFVSAASSEVASVPVIAVEPGGNAIAAWLQAPGSGQTQLWVARYVSGEGWQSALRETLSPTLTARKPSIGIDARGRGFVAWHESDNVSMARFD